MVSIETARQMALSFPETDEHPHFDRKAFRVKKKIFATMQEKEKRMMVRLTLVDQSVFCAFDPAVIYPVTGGWGRQGATIIELGKIKKAMFSDALTTAYCTVAPKKLAEPYQRL
jgi:hypothetical protein